MNLRVFCVFFPGMWCLPSPKSHVLITSRFYTCFFRRQFELVLFSRLSGFGTVATQCLRWRQEQSPEDSQVETVQAGNLGTETEAMAAMFGNYFHFSWLLAVSSSPEAMLKRYLNRTKTQVTPEFCSWCFRWEDTRTSPMVMIWWDFSKKT